MKNLFIMKKHWKLPSVILMLNCIMLSASAQETLSDKKVKIELGVGINFSGPQQEMGDLMKTHGYDDSSENWFTGDIITNPNYSNIGLNSHISISYCIAPKSQLGIMLSRSNFGNVSGYSNTKGSIDFGFKNTSIIPFYTFEPKEVLEIQVGPALMINSANNTTSSGNYASENCTDNSIGLFTGLNLKLWDRKVTFGKLGANYLLTTNFQIGPYTTESSGNSYTFPESKINFSHLNVVFAFGFNL
jgi:hypothetical protein